MPELQSLPWQDGIQLSREWQLAIAITSGLFGLVVCFFGYRLFRVMLVIAGFAIGAVIGAGLGYYWGDGAELATLGGGAAGGVVGAVSLILMYYVGVFLAGGALAGGLAALITQQYMGKPEPIAMLAAGVGGGVIALILQKLLIILATSLGGAWNVVMASYLIATQRIELINTPQDWQQISGELPVLVGISAMLGIAGIVIQYAVTGKKKRPAATLAPAPVVLAGQPIQPTVVGTPSPAGGSGLRAVAGPDSPDNTGQPPADNR